MELGYFYLDWNHIPGLFNRKEYMHTLVIPPADLQHICDPENLTEYWEPMQDPDYFHTTLAFIRDWFDNCDDLSCRKEKVISVAVVRKLSQLPAYLI